VFIVEAKIVDQAVEKLGSLAVATSRFSGRGHPTILWPAIDHQDQELMKEEVAGPEEPSAEPN
jgi:hypothetical protein